MKLNLVAATMLIAGGWGSCTFGQVTEVESLLAKEPKLMQKVRLKVEGMSVSELLKRLAKKTGVALSAEGEAETDKVIIFSPSRPLIETLEDVAELFGDVWTANTQKTGDLERTRYTLVRTTRVRERERELRETYTRNLMKALEIAVHPPGEKRAGREGKTLLMGTLFSALDAQQHEALIREGVVTLPLNRLNAAQWKTLTEARPGLLALVNGDKTPGGTRTNPTLYNNGGGVRRPPGNVRAVPPSAPSTEASRATEPMITEADQQIYDGGLLFSLRSILPRPNKTLAIEFVNEAASVSVAVAVPLALPDGNPYGGKRRSTPDNVPTLEQIFPAKEGDLLTRLAVLAEKTKRPVLCDFYRTQPVMPSAGGAVGIPQTSPSEMRLAFSYGDIKRAWWTKGETLLFRQRDWFLQSQYEISDEWLDKVAKQIAAHGGNPTLGDLARLHELTNEQKIALETQFDPLKGGALYGLNDLIARKVAYETADFLSGLRLQKWNARTKLFSEADSDALVFKSEQCPARLLEILDFGFAPLYPRSWRQAKIDIRLSSTKSDVPSLFPVKLTFAPDGELFTSATLNLPIGVPDDRRDKAEIE